MEIELWEGTKGSNNGFDNSDYVLVRFEGKLLGSYQLTCDERGNRGTSFDIYQSTDGTIIIHRVNWSRWPDESDQGFIYEFNSLEEAAADWRVVLENAGVVDRSRLSLEEWRRRQNH